MKNIDEVVKIRSLEKITNSKFLNLYQIIFDVKGKEINYYVASRRSIERLKINTKEKRADAVRIVPYVKKDGKIFAVVTKEYRFPINEYVYSTPAGNIDAGETPEQAAERETMEEIGAKVKRLIKIDDGSYSSVGMTDETIACFVVEVESFGETQQESTEFITHELVPIEKLMQFADEKVDDMQAKYLLKMLAYEWKLKRYNENTIKL